MYIHTHIHIYIYIYLARRPLPFAPNRDGHKERVCPASQVSSHVPEHASQAQMIVHYIILYHIMLYTIIS